MIILKYSIYTISFIDMKKNSTNKRKKYIEKDK